MHASFTLLHHQSRRTANAPTAVNYYVSTRRRRDNSALPVLLCQEFRQQQFQWHYTYQSGQLSHVSVRASDVGVAPKTIRGGVGGEVLSTVTRGRVRLVESNDHAVRGVLCHGNK